MKKVLLDSCTKTASLLHNVLYEQCDDGASMRSSLGPVLAISVRTECENVIVKPLIETAVLMFYFRCFSNDTVLMFKKDKIQYVLN